MSDKAPRIDKDKVLIDRMIDWMAVNRPNVDKPIKTSLGPKELHKALGLNALNDVFPASVTYRGYTVLAQEADARR